MDNTFIISITDSAFICTNNTTGCLGVAGFTGNTMSRNIVNIVCIQQQLILADNTSQIRRKLTCRQTISSHSTIALDVVDCAPYTCICTINARNTACYSTFTGDNGAMVIAVADTAVVFAYKATDITAAAFYGIAIAGNIADGAAVIFCCYSANTVISILTGEYGRSDVDVFNYRATAQLAKNTAFSLQADNCVTITIKRACKSFSFSATADSVIGAIAFCIHQTAGIDIIFQDIIIA